MGDEGDQKVTHEEKVTHEDLREVTHEEAKTQVDEPVPAPPDTVEDEE